MKSYNIKNVLTFTKAACANNKNAKYFYMNNITSKKHSIYF